MENKISKYKTLNNDNEPSLEEMINIGKFIENLNHNLDVEDNIESLGKINELIKVAVSKIDVSGVKIIEKADQTLIKLSKITDEITESRNKAIEIYHREGITFKKKSNVKYYADIMYMFFIVFLIMFVIIAVVIIYTLINKEINYYPY